MIGHESIPFADGNGYYAELSVFHELHCLVCISFLEHPRVFIQTGSTSQCHFISFTAQEQEQRCPFQFHLQLERKHKTAVFKLEAYVLECHVLCRLLIPTLHHVQLLACIN